jgi:CheY-like chemotaxis protein
MNVGGHRMNHDENNSAPEDPPKAGLRVLVVDDDDSSRAAVTALIQQEGHHVAMTECPHKALGILGVETFDLVLSDVNMPGLDGVQFRAEAMKRAINVSFAYITGGTLTTDALMALPGERCGVVFVLRKPFSRRELRHALERLRQNAL